MPGRPQCHCSVAAVMGTGVYSVNISADGKSIAHFLEGLPTAYPYGLMISQSDTEHVLDEFLNSLGVKVERTIELTRFTASNSKVVSTLRHADGAEEIAETSWLIGCDGAHSTVRHQLGMDFHGETSLINWILADIHLENIPRVKRALGSKLGAKSTYYKVRPRDLIARPHPGWDREPWESDPGRQSDTNEPATERA